MNETMTTEEHPPHLAHHFDTPKQQFEASKLGMWLFLGTELLLFGGLFCAYSVYRSNHPELFEYGSQFLDTRWGAINTAVLILSSMTMAVAVTAAQLGRTRMLITLLLATFMGGAVFMAIKFIEYHHKIHEGLVWGEPFYEQPSWVIAARRAERERAAWLAESAEGAEAARPPDIDQGREFWTATCRSCHGAAGEGVAGQGKDLRASEFVTGMTDEELVEFLSVGRVASDPLNTTGVEMPPRGGNPMFSDADLLDIVVFVRTLMTGEAPAGEPTEAAAPTETIYVSRWVVPDPRPGPAGLDQAALAREEGRSTAPPEAEFEHPPLPHHSVDEDRPANAHMFFAIYFCMTGLHGLHVLAGMAVMAWLAVRAICGHFGPDYFTPVDLGGLYWHVVDLIWIFLFPLFYLIG
jgi:cytochrome c oxidase subunit 3